MLFIVSSMSREEAFSKGPLRWTGGVGLVQSYLASA